MGDLDFDTLKKLYEEDLLTDGQIAERFGLKQASVSRIRRRWGIKTLDKTGRMARSLPDLTERQKELIVGSLLGDGHMRASSKASVFLSEGHSEKQTGYTRWKAEIFGEYVSSIYPGSKTVRGKEYKSLSYKTHSCPQLRPWYDLFYPLGKRVFPSELSDLMTPFVLAVWYMDDGSLANPYTSRIAFGLDGVSLERAELAFEKLDLFPTLHRGNGKRKKEVDIWFNKGSAERFRELVTPHIPECMAYKIPKESPRLGELENARLATPEKVQEARDSGMSVSELSDNFGINRGTVRRRLGGVEQVMGRGKGKSVDLGLTDKELRGLYLRFSDDEIGKQFRTSGNNISYWRKKWNIPTLNGHQKRAALGLPSILDLDEESLRELYQLQGDRQIAERYGTTKPVIARLRRQWSIESLSKSERSKLSPKRVLQVPQRPSPSPVVPKPEKAPEPLFCSICREPIEGTRRRNYCDLCRKKRDAERARGKRAAARKSSLPKTTRTFTCKQCGEKWETSAKGRFSHCLSCKEKRDQAKRTKTCQYRHCDEEFLDTSKQNSMKFCRVEHRRREKLFRSGKAKDESYFQS